LHSTLFTAESGQTNWLCSAIGNVRESLGKYTHSARASFDHRIASALSWQHQQQSSKDYN
jgi:hypothetical protein